MILVLSHDHVDICCRGTDLSDDVTDGLDNAASFDCAIGDGWQQRSEGEVVSGRDDLNLIRRIFQAFEEAGSSPARSQHHHLLLRDFGPACVSKRSSQWATL